MIFLIFGILDVISAIASVVLCFVFETPLYLIGVIPCVMSAVLFFTLYDMEKDIDRLDKNVSIVQKSLNECREKLGLAPLEKENPKEEKNAPTVDNSVEVDEEISDLNQLQKDECPSCFQKVSPTDKLCPNCGFVLIPEEKENAQPFEEEMAYSQQDAFDEEPVEQEDDTPAKDECPYCFHKLQGENLECPNCGFSYLGPVTQADLDIAAARAEEQDDTTAPLAYIDEEDEEFNELNQAKEDECPNCFSYIEKSDKLCPNCGYKLK